MNTDYKCLTIVHIFVYICYTFLAIDDIIATSVNTYTSMVKINTEGKYLIKSLRKNKKYEAKRLLKLFPNKNWSLGGLKALIKNWQHTYCSSTYWAVVDNTLFAQCLCRQFFFDQRFQSTKTPVFVRIHFKQSLCSIFLIFSQRFDQVLIFSANSHHWLYNFFTACAMLILQALYYLQQFRLSVRPSVHHTRVLSQNGGT